MLGGDLPVIVALATFAVVILVIALDWCDMIVAAMCGVMVFLLTGIITNDTIAATLDGSRGSIALLFGGMVVARVLAPTGLFDLIGQRILLATKGSGRRLLLALVAVVAPVCAVLPNATVVLLLGPVMVRVANAMKIDFVPLLILVAIVSNASGLLTLVGDPATFIVGSAIQLSFNDYLQKVSLGGLLSVLTVLPMLPLLFSDIWKSRSILPPQQEPVRLQRPLFALVAVLILIVMVTLFVVGEDIFAIPAPAVAIVGATLALLAIYGWKVEPVDRVLADIDWKTLIFILCMFFMVQGLVGTGALNSGSRILAGLFGDDTLIAALALLVFVGAASSVLANTPVVVAMLVLVKGYLVLISVVPEEALGHTFLETWPDATLPVFVGMMFGATLGGNATLIGAAANIVAGGIGRQNGRPITFAGFARYGVPITLAQLAVAAAYTVGLYLITRG